VGRAMTRVVHSPRHAFQRASHILCWSTRDGRVLMEIAAWGTGLMFACVPPPPRWIAHRLPKIHVTKLAGSMGMPPSPCVSTPLPPSSAGYISNEKPEGFSLDDLKGGPPEFFPTHTCDVYSPIGLLGSILMKME
jgi:hypothetical protein